MSSRNQSNNMGIPKQYLLLYEYIQKLATNEDNQETNPRFNHTFIHEWFDVCHHSVSDETLNLLKKLDTYIPAVNNVCKYLSHYELIMIYQKLAEDTCNWKVAIEKMFTTEIAKFNWMCSIYSGTNYKGKRVTAICNSKFFFETLSDSCITFFKSAHPNVIQHMLPSLKYQKIKVFKDFLLEDITFGTQIHHQCMSMTKIHIYDPLIGEKKNVHFASLFFPTIPGINVKYFNNASDFSEKLQPGEVVKCLLIFSTLPDAYELVDLLLQHLMNQQSINIPIGGSFAIKSMLHDPRAESTIIAFTQLENSANIKFTSASIVIESDQNFEEELSKFKSSIVRRTEEICLNMVCFAKKMKFQEWDLILKYFDHNCFVLQIEVNGEIGSNCYKNENSESFDDTKRFKQNYIHGYTSVLFYIGWGEIRT